MRTQGAPLEDAEVVTIEQQSGVSSWRDVAAGHDPPSPHLYDVFISHTSQRADQPLKLCKRTV